MEANEHRDNWDSEIHGTVPMADLVREKDWSKTALEPIEQWPSELVSNLSLVLTSKVMHPAFRGSGRNSTYNDALLPALSDERRFACSSNQSGMSITSMAITIADVLPLAGRAFIFIIVDHRGVLAAVGLGLDHRRNKYEF